MQALSRLTRVARPLNWITLASLIALPLSFAYAQFRQDKWRSSTLAEYPDLTMPAEVTGPIWTGIALVDLMAIALSLFVLWQVHKLLHLYINAQILTDQNALYIKRAGQGLVALAAFGVIGQTIDVLMLTWGNPAGQRSLSISLTDIEIGLVLAGGVMVLIGWAMAQAADIAQDHARII